MVEWFVVIRDDVLLAVMEAMLKIWGVEGALFCCPEDAIDWIDGLDADGIIAPRPHIAFLDLYDYFHETTTVVDVAVRLRQNPYLHNIVIVLTWSARLSAKEEQEFIIAADADAFIHMPWPKLNNFKKMMDDMVAKRLYWLFL